MTDLATREIPRTRVLGVPISLIDLSKATKQISEWALDKTKSRAVFVRDSPSVVLVSEQEELLGLHENASLVVADGAPLFWICRMYSGGNEIGRVPGADLVESVCKLSLATGQSHFFYGGRPTVAQTMADLLSKKYLGLKVAGTCSPPMLDIGPDFEVRGPNLEDAKRIQESGADFVWVGISTPKQEYWISKAAPIVGHGVFIGVGAAFDFHSGNVQRAPAWMRNNGLEWLHRLGSEPRRLWRRYLVLAPRFAFLALLELSRRLGRA
ncbi:MAG: WecB/TagA/CpsF family glycosyltransferase [Bradyrhizobium sp.]|uniref:WecB/TagA/CpsF family glycosyltransferase n=1 Tax=Bradyrhizobium sp. TaxID=376 RepID=UPI002390B981|nr:WecB/TagA/CpsF family glycosyltransferase [Bradyrhizobium sp.]MDE2472652.1 WecB/TagA/CpsF family glycosyltransferase [Bradyrhizobium sp.]